MADEQEAKLFTVENRPEEVAYINERHPEEFIREHGRQLVSETERSLQNLESAIAGGQLDMDNPSMRDAVMSKLRELRQLLERSSLHGQRMERGERVVPEREQPDALSQFIQFTEDLRIRVTAKAEELRLQEQRYRAGDITDEGYRRVANERVRFNDAFEDEIRKRAVGVDASDPLFKLAFEIVNEQLNTGLNISPQERLDSLWATQERGLLPFVHAYAQNLEVFRAGKLSEADMHTAWKEKADAFQRFQKKLQSKRGLHPAEVLELERHAADILRPAEPMPVLLTVGETASHEAAGAIPEESLTELEPLLDRESYDEKVAELLRHVIEWEGVTDTLEGAGKLTPNVRADLLEELRKYPAQLLELDEKAEEPLQSDERRALVDLLTKFRERLSSEFYISDKQPLVPQRPPPVVELEPFDGDAHSFIAKEKPSPHAPEVEFEAVDDDEHSFMVKTKPSAKAAGVAEAREAHRRVVAAYTSVQHTLSVDQRRDMRTRIARMAGLVLRVELEQSIAHATEHAPALAHATLTSMPRRFEVKTIPAMISEPKPANLSRGILSILGDAFRIR